MQDIAIETIFKVFMNSATKRTEEGQNKGRMISRADPWMESQRAQALVVASSPPQSRGQGHPGPRRWATTQGQRGRDASLGSKAELQAWRIILKTWNLNEFVLPLVGLPYDLWSVVLIPLFFSNLSLLE